MRLAAIVAAILLLASCGERTKYRYLPMAPDTSCHRANGDRLSLASWAIHFNNVELGTVGDTTEISAIKGDGPGRRHFKVSIVRASAGGPILIGAEFKGFPGYPDTAVMVGGASNPQQELFNVFLPERLWAGDMIANYNEGACPGSFTYSYPVEIYLGRHTLRVTIACADWVCYGVPLHFETHGVSLDGIPIPDITDDVRNYPLIVP